MKKRLAVVYWMTAMFLLVLSVLGLMEIQQYDFPFSVVVTTQGGSETIKCWQDSQCYYVFLPSGTDPDQAKLVSNPLFPVRINGERVDKKTVCGNFPFFVELPLSYQKWGKSYEETVCFYQSDNVPTLYIDTASGSMDYIHSEKGNAESGMLRLYRPDGTLDCDTQIRSINGRGNITWTKDKKPYSLELMQKEDILGMGAAKKWILLANAIDPTNMCNKMCYDLAARAGCAYTPECQWVDLYLNGNYAGLYLISERNEVDTQRVNISKKGSFLISKERADRWMGRNYSAFFSRREDFFRIHYAGMDEDWIWEIWQSVEDSIFAEDGIDPRTGKSWDELIDVESWAQQFLIWDCFIDIDAAFLSKFFYYDASSELVFAGPLWDMDNIFSGLSTYPISILASERRFIWEWGQESIFYYLSLKDSFRETVKQLYWEKFRPLLLELAESGMDQYREQIHTAAFLNDIRWGRSNAEEVIEQRKGYLLDRIGFLDDYLGSEEDYCMISLIILKDNQWRSIAVRRGEIADFLFSDGATWLDYETGEPFDVTVPVMDDWVIYQARNKEE